MQADDLAPALGVDGHGDYCGNADDPPAFAYLEIGGIEPEIRPFAGERAFQKGMDALVNVLAKLGDGGLGDAGHAHGLDEFIDPRSEEHTSELQSLMRISYAVFCLKQKHISIPRSTHNN